MPSFTSSSDRAPQINVKTLLLGTVLMTAFFIGAVELFWRSQQVTPNYDEGVKSWSYYRDEIGKKANSQATVLLGASRMVSAISLDHFRQGTGDMPVYQLSVSGMAPLATLKDIAENTDFNGVVLMALSTQGLYNDGWQEQAAHVNYYHRNWGWNSQINFWFDRQAQGTFITRHPAYGINSVVKAIVNNDRKLSGPVMNATTIERQRNIDFSQIDIEPYRANVIS